MWVKISGVTHQQWLVSLGTYFFFFGGDHFEITIINKQGGFSISTKWVPCPTMGAVAVWGWVIILHLGPLVRTRICVAMSSATTLQWARARSIRSWTCLQQISFALKAKAIRFPIHWSLSLKCTEPWAIWVCLKMWCTPTPNGFCWSLSLLNGYFIGNINPTFSDKPI